MDAPGGCQGFTNLGHDSGWISELRHERRVQAGASGRWRTDHALIVIDRIVRAWWLKCVREKQPVCKSEREIKGVSPRCEIGCCRLF